MHGTRVSLLSTLLGWMGSSGRLIISVLCISLSPGGIHCLPFEDATIRLRKFEANKVGLRPIDLHAGSIDFISFSRM